MFIKRCLPSLLKRLSIMFIAACSMLPAIAGVNGPETDPADVLINVPNAKEKVAQLFSLIQQQSAFVFAYDENDIDLSQNLTLKTGRHALNLLLDNVARQTGLSFTQKQNTILVNKKTFVSLKKLNQSVYVVSGNVKDARGGFVIGTTVTVKGTLRSTFTDASGNFSIEANGNEVLLFSNVGYLSQEVPVNDRTFIQIVLAEGGQNMGEVVVVGYQTQRRSDLTGAVSSVNVADLAKLPVGTVEQALQGKSSGVRVTQTTGQPGEGVSIRIRGVGTINNNDPLFIVDGIPTKDGIGFLSTADIESITVLKDAASAAIYGARASNGVVVVTTKGGRKGKAQFNYTTYGGIQTHGKLPELTNAAQYIELYNEAADNDNAGVTNPALIRNKIPAGTVTANTDWLKEIFRNGSMQNHQLSVTGGNDKTLYYLSGNYFKQEGIIANSSYERYSLLSKLTIDLTDRLTIGNNLTVSYSKRNIIGSSGDGYAGNGGSVVRYALFRTPAIPVFDSAGVYSDMPAEPGFFGDGYNPVALAAKTDNVEKLYRIFGNFYAAYKITRNLRFKTDVGVDALITNGKRFDENYGTNFRINRPNRLVVNSRTKVNVVWNNTFTYTKVIKGVHNFSFLAGTEAISNNEHYQEGTDQAFANQSKRFRFIGNGSGLMGSTTASESQAESALFSLFGNANYSYQNRFLVSGNIRRDGSSRFGPDNKYGNFYSGSAGWNLIKENWVKNTLPLFSRLKLRAGYGKLGNQEIPDYAFVSTIGNGLNYPFGTLPSSNPGSVINKQGNSKIKWETSTQIDVGLDMGILRDRLTLTVDYFLKTTSDMLVNIPTPLIGGTATSPILNAGRVRNKGLEFEINYKNNSQAITYDINANFSTIQNKVLSLSTGEPISGGRIDTDYDATLTKVGQPIGAFYLLEIDGIFQNEREIFSSAFQSLEVKPGDIRFKDQNGDGLIDKNDRKFLGSAIPKFSYGVTANLQYKAFDLSLFFQGQYGNKIYSQVNMDIEGFYRSFNVTKRVYDERWRGEGTSTTMPRVSWNAATNNKYPSSRFLEDGSYVRMKNIQVGYTIPERLTSRYRIKSLRLYVTGQNLWTITKFTGLDPEMYVSDNARREKYNGDIAAGIDWGTYPSAKNYIIGLNVNF